jgi:Xaa-Pro dipeptidase
MFMNDVPHEQFHKRRLQLRDAAAKMNLKGVIVCSRGGGTFDRYSGALYFANHYQQRCFLPDNLPHWSGRSHSFLFIPVLGDPVLLVSTTEYRKDLVSIADIRFSNDIYQLLADTAREKGMDSGAVGIIGEDVLPYKTYRLLRERLTLLELVPCDSTFEMMRTIKTDREILSIRKASAIGSEAMRLIMENVAAGKTESEIIAPGIAHVIAKGAALYFVVTSSGLHSDAVHSLDFPGYASDRRLKNGELFKVDLIIAYEGYISDFGRTGVVGGKASPAQRALIETVTAACEEIISRIRPGRAIAQLCRIGDDFLRRHNVSLAEETQDDPEKMYAAFPPHWGHGIGLSWEEPWLVESDPAIVQEGMYIAVEKALFQPGIGAVTYEQNLLVGAEGAEVLTTAKKIWI